MTTSLILNDSPFSFRKQKPVTCNLIKNYFGLQIAISRSWKDEKKKGPGDHRDEGKEMMWALATKYSWEWIFDEMISSGAHRHPPELKATQPGRIARCETHINVSIKKRKC